MDEGVEEKFQASDLNNDGLLTYEEFLGFLQTQPSEDAWTLFRLIDLNNDGFVDIWELEDYLARRGKQLAQAN